MFRNIGLLLATFAVITTAQGQFTSCIPQDIVFMVDSSEGVGLDNFQKELEFIKSTINNYDISQQCVHIGILTFSGQVYNQFDLGHYNTKAQIMSAIDQIQYQPGRRYTTEAIKYLNAQSFGQFRGARSNAEHIGILVTNGPPSNSLALQQEASRARQNGVTLYTVGIGQGTHLQDLVSVASTPSSRYAMTAQNFDSLGDLAYPLASRTMSESPTLPVATGCLQKADLVFVVDGSGSIGPTNFAKLQDFLKNLVKQLNVGTDAVHVGVMKFSNYPSIEFPLDMHYSRADIMKAIDNINYIGGGTNTAEAISYMDHQMFSQNSGARPNVPRIAVVITDGRSSNPITTASAANQARVDHIGMMSVGIGNGVDQSELHAIADQPPRSNSFMVSDYDQLNSIAAQIIERACQVRAMAPIPTTAQPGVSLPDDPCKDVQPNCKSFGENVCFEYAPWSKDNCARFCGICKPMYTTAPPPCVDRLKDCVSYGTRVCHDNNYKAWAGDNCRKFCGFCGAESGAIGFYGQCRYKGQSYQHGEKWLDGCDYECVCEDGQTGRYRCYNRCPLYYNLPSECTLVRSPTECCQQPVCNFNQQIQTLTSNSMGRTPSGIPVCAYKQKMYYQSQTWQDGCDYQCTCTNSATGEYKCQDLCPTYTSIPPYCHMTKQNGDCCSKPVCDFTTQQGTFTGTGSISGGGVGKTPTTPPPCIDVAPNCERFGHDACINYAGWAGDNCRKFCNLCNMKPTPGPDDQCMYDGNGYSQGQRWMISCDTQCVCEDAIYGYYRCTNICPTYSNLPTGCYETKKSGDCCTSVQCDSGTILTSTNNLGTIGSGGLIVVKNPNQPQIIPTIPGGGNPQPGTGGTGMQAPTLRGCLYHGELYLEGQMWDDGCQYSCICRSAQDGYYECSSKCPDFPNLPVGCHLEADESEPCCQTPKCIDPKTPVIPVFSQGTTGHGVVRPPSVTDLYNNTYQVHYTILYNNTVPQPTPGHQTGGQGIGYCIYKGQQHNQGDTWDDGCDYKCVCEDASIGKWRCRERCLKYQNLPQQCHLVTSKADACCKEPTCDFTGVVNHFTGAVTLPVGTQPPVMTTPTPIPTTPQPRMCVYGGKQYSQNQMWYDGCKYKCTCDNAMLGFYRCTNRCPEYQNVPTGCDMVPDTQDPACCKVPQCNFTPAPNGNTGSGTIVTLSPGSFQGSNPGGTNTNVGYCMYKGQKYQQGQRWDDGCQYKCECRDANSGLYQCDETCPRYGNLPYPCVLITDYRNPCCKVPDCTFNGNYGEITGTLTPAPHIGPTIAPLPGQTNPPTPAPVLNYCLYKDVKYYQGQTWDDGCDKRCRCDDSTRGLYTCDDRCPTYPTLPSACHLVTDPADICCTKPDCDFTALLKNVTGTLSPNMIPTLAPPAKITGQVNTPTPRPGLTPQPITKCLYKGVEYSTGERWDDGCQYNCICNDGSMGKYTCDEKCPKYGTLPQECSLQKDPANPCCYKPECIFNPNVNEILGQGTTKAPNLGPTQAPTPYTGLPTQGPYPTPALPKDVCVYKGKSYTQDQQWYDGCDYSCVCENAMQGLYRCSRRCAEFMNLPKECTLVADDKDPLCCKVPKCDIPAQYNNKTGFVPIPTPNPGIITGGSATNAPTPAPNMTPIPGQPNPTPGPTPAPRDICTYKGKEYTQGQKWQDGCDYDCECVNAQMGFYRCQEKCPRYNNLPPQCRLVADILNPCCQKPYCDFTGNTGEITGTLTPAPGLQTTLAPLPNGQTRPPTPQPTPKMPDTCLYNGVAFNQGQTWDDGCDLKCVCENGMTGFYRCSDRCAKYNNVPAGCTLVTDPSDSCCRIPSCQPVQQPTPQPGQQPTPGPGMTPNPNPTPQPPIIPTVPAVIIGQGVTPTPRPGMPTVATQSPPVPVCMYNGKTYTQGQTFDDGCDLHCECFDAPNGRYKCTKRCQTYVNLPTNCRLSIDPNDACCKIATCSPTPAPFMTPAPNMTPNPTPGQTGPTIAPNLQSTSVPNPVTTVAPVPKNVCVMNGRQYTQGQTWFDGCQKKCVCEDGTTGFYRCSDRCREYKNVPPTCTMVPDPSDPQCCQLPQCIPGVNGQPTPRPQATPLPNMTPAPELVTGQPLGVVTGFAPSPTPTPMITLAPKPGQPNPTPGPTPAPKMVCVYKGQAYGQGQRWQDGCDFNCVCTDGMTGHYECTERCPSYPAIPPYCHLETDPVDYCCQRPVCDYNKPVTIPTPSPNMPSTVAPNMLSTQTPIPGQPTTQVPTPQPVLAFCVYSGVAYRQGETWSVGCDKFCRCDDASKNVYNCRDRCPTYNIQPGCTWVTDPSDSCCQLPQCLATPTPQPNLTPVPGVTPQGQPTLGPNATPTVTPYPSPLPQGVTGSVIGKPQVPSLRGTCEYMGQQYATGQKWDDGCRYHCECIDGMSGQYKCDERCPRYPSIPSYCVLVQDPNDACCKSPSCSVQVPTPMPNVTPSPQPTVKPLPGQSTPVPFTTLSPIMTPPTQPPVPVVKDVCIMSGKAYTQGQRWDDGCDKVCVCDDGKTGHYTCSDRCPTYMNISPSCIMVPDPQDPVCCKIPQCQSTVSPLYGQITGQNPTPGPNMQPTPGGQNTPTPQPNNYPTPYPGGTYPPNMLPSIIPTQAPQPGQTPNPNPTPQPQPKACVYNGVQYSQGQRWRDGCKYDCICDDAMTGKYTCTDICPRYPPLPATCRMVYDASNPCCQKPDCSNPTPNPLLTPSPGPNATPNPNPTQAPKLEFCIYNGIPYRQGQSWQDGCSKVCRCEDAAARQVTCTDRCPTYPQLQPGCTYITDPSDACCQVPKCEPQPNIKNPTAVVTGPKGTIDGSNIIVPNQPNPGITGKSNVCLYKGMIYNQGQTWTDGCTYNCVCLDSTTGHYQCTEKCAKIPQLPSYCTLVQDPQDQCCQLPYCQNPQPTPSPNMQPTPGTGPTPNPLNTPTPGPGQVTLAPKPKDVCVYQGNMYQENQVWYDGCNAKCRCEDSTSGYYRCQERCARYTNIPSDCIMVPDPADPTCCSVPQCPVKPTAGPLPTPGFIPTPQTPQPGVITGLGPVINPTLAPPLMNGQTTLAPQPRTGCSYRGLVYQKGQKWADGCTYDCECLDDMTGQYKCVEKCAKFPNLDSRCVLIQDPQEPCCQKPYCDFIHPTPFPNGIPTPNPSYTPTPRPGLQPTPSPNPNTVQGKCVYKGVFYSQGQTWDDGCDFTCQCDDAMNNLYSCHQRCKVYQQVPNGCKLTTDPNDQCCLIPNCNINLFPKNPGEITGTTPQGFTINPQFVTGPSGTRPQYVFPTPVLPGTFTGVSGTGGQNPLMPNGGTSFSGTSNACIYKGKTYQQGQTWDDGCAYRCECIDASRGQYRCTDRCPSYPFLPPQCTYVNDPNDMCCQTARCDMFATPSPQPTIAPVVTPSPQPTIAPGTTHPPIIINPNQNTGPTGTMQPPVTTISSIVGTADKCLYKGQLYARGDRWQDGCNLNCICENPVGNHLRCTSRCKSYSSIPSFCTLQPDPVDPCCSTVSCTAGPNGQQLIPMIPDGKPTPSPTLAPNMINVIPVGTHTVVTGSGLPNGQIPGMTGGRSVCIYHNHAYNEGESWDDGCKYVCTCEDGSTGLYKCTSKCPEYPALPSYCSFTSVPGQCCPSLHCNSPNIGNYNPNPQLVPTPRPNVAPTPGQSPYLIVVPGQGTATTGQGPIVTPGTSLTQFTGSTNNLCIYNGKVYNKGDKWDDGCNYHCECLEGQSGYFKCTPFCPTYSNMPSQCYMVTQPGQCSCQKPMCTGPDGTQVNPLQPGSKYPVVGSYGGGYTGFRPNYVPGQSMITGNRSNVCIYNGKVYQQSQRWEDGCDYTCECVDSYNGQYRCTEKCPTYTSMPAQCRMYDVPGDCCKEVRCDMTQVPPTPQVPTPQPYTPHPHVDPNCFDAIDNCKAYGQEACSAQFEAWSKKNCAAYCHHCTPSITPAPTVCEDRLTNCAAFGQSACQGQYIPWAMDNCIKFCGLCPNTNTVAPVTVAPNTQCVDKISNCNEYGQYACQQPYLQWAQDNCMKYCNFCQGTGVTVPQQVQVALPGAGWMIMMKGVAGVPGDLYQIWMNPTPVNQNVPQAMYLTSQFPGHYKPDLANHWSELCIDKVKVAVYNNGVEKAYIIFNAIGANKDNWFDKSRIIESTYTDIQNAPKEFFSMIGDVSSGREFYMSGQSNGQCDSQGWMMVSTQNGCPFEASSGAKPAFLYAPGQTMTHWSQTSAGRGDVFAILAHQDCSLYTTPRPTIKIGTTVACIYKNQVYSQGQTWVDGCDYNCTCVDANAGRYVCNGLCPVYNNMPPGCTLKKQPGECCSYPDCGHGIITNGQFTGMCIYKDRTYQHGEKWSDGCQYNCECVDGSTGKYVCKEKCYTWNLPDVCTMQGPDPGFCCSTPKCPDYVQITYPQDYVKQ